MKTWPIDNSRMMPSEHEPRTFRCQPSRKLMLFCVLFFGLCATVIFHKASSNTRGLRLGGLITLSPSGATTFYWILGGFLCLFVLAAGWTLVTTMVHRVPDVTLTHDSISFPSGFPVKRALTLPLSQITDTSLTEIGGQRFLILHTPTKKHEILLNWLESEEAEMALRQELARRLATASAASSLMPSPANAPNQAVSPYIQRFLSPQFVQAGDSTLPQDSASCLDAISSHIERYWGTIGPIYHEKASDGVHVDVHVVQATAERPYHTLITSGMSDRAMTTRPGSEHCRYAEVLLALPPTWPLDAESFQDPRHYWPILLLKEAARFPHIFGTFLWVGHTFANGNPPEPYAPDVPFTASMLVPPSLVPSEAHTLRITPEKEIQFIAVVPIYPDEHERAREIGLAMLRSAMKGRVNELIDIKRTNYGDYATFMREMAPPSLGGSAT